MPKRDDISYAWHFQTRELSKVFQLVNSGCSFYAYSEMAGLFTGIARWDKPKSKLTIQLLTRIPFVNKKTKEEKFEDILKSMNEPIIFGRVPLDPRARGVKSYENRNPLLRPTKKVRANEESDS